TRTRFSTKVFPYSKLRSGAGQPQFGQIFAPKPTASVAVSSIKRAICRRAGGGPSPEDQQFSDRGRKQMGTMGTLKVLVADDHEVVRKGLRTILEEQPGWEVSGEASDGREAVDKVKTLKPDVTVVDVGMPGLNGLEATRQMLKNDPE